VFSTLKASESNHFMKSELLSSLTQSLHRAATGSTVYPSQKKSTDRNGHEEWNNSASTGRDGPSEAALVTNGGASEVDHNIVDHKVDMEDLFGED
jgi:hypothetical protein